MPRPEDFGYPKLVRGAGTIYLNDGKWQGLWRKAGHKPESFRDVDYMNVYKEMTARHHRREMGRYVAPAEMTVQDLVESYIERRIAYKKWGESTIHLHQRNARLHIYPELGPLRVISVDLPRLQHWIDQLARTLAPNTISACTSLVYAAFASAVKMTIIPANPCTHLEHPKPEPVVHRTWTLEEIGRVNHVLRDDPKWLAVYRLMLSTGMRPGELRVLTWGDIDFAAGRIRIARTVTEDTDGHLVVGDSTKSGRTRYVTLTAGPRAALLQWQATLVRRSLNPQQDWIFPNTLGKPMGRDSWAKRHARLCKEAKVPLITFHELRHTSASLEMAEGVSLKVVSERLGHKDPAFTARVYQHVDTELQQSAADALDERLFGER
jgi:integrase